MLILRSLSKRYGATVVFHDVSLTLQRGEFVALLGESGVGKSTLLNCIAGLDTADSGSVELAGHDLAVVGPVQAGDAVQQRRLADPRFAHQGDEFAGRQRQRHVVEDRGFAEALAQFSDRQHGAR